MDRFDRRSIEISRMRPPNVKGSVHAWACESPASSLWSGWRGREEGSCSYKNGFRVGARRELVPTPALLLHLSLWSVHSSQNNHPCSVKEGAKRERLSNELRKRTSCAVAAPWLLESKTLLRDCGLRELWSSLKMVASGGTGQGPRK